MLHNPRRSVCLAARSELLHVLWMAAVAGTALHKVRRVGGTWGGSMAPEEEGRTRTRSRGHCSCWAPTECALPGTTICCILLAPSAPTSSYSLTMPSERPWSVSPRQCSTPSPAWITGSPSMALTTALRGYLGVRREELFQGKLLNWSHSLPTSIIVNLKYCMSKPWTTTLQSYMIIGAFQFSEEWFCINHHCYSVYFKHKFCTSLVTTYCDQCLRTCDK